MELSIFVAKVLAIIYLSVAYAAFTGKTDWSKMLKSFDASPALTYVTGMITVLLGMILVQYHNLWVKDWPVLITIVGWAAVIKGIMFIAFPHSLNWFKGWYKNTQAFGFLLLAIGLLFGYYGFLA